MTILPAPVLPSPEKRIRRTPDEARRVILDAAEAVMDSSGPAGLRLQDVAAAAGVSHPTILHHFGSREGLILAVNKRAIEDLRSGLLRTMTDGQTSGASVATAFAAYRNGLAQRMLWLLQSQTEFGAAGLPLFDEIVDALQALRQSIAAPGVEVDIHDTRAIVHLTTLAAFGDAIIGARLRQAKDSAAELAARARFEAWFTALITGFIAGNAGLQP